MSRYLQTQRRPAAPLTSTSLLKPSPPSHVAPAVKAGTQGGGTALDKHTNAEMSARFDHDFSQVRIHTDSRAEDAAGAVGANAFALGADIVFGAGKYQPGSSDTDRLLAHELTHVVQQAQWGGPGDWGRASAKSDASEREADRSASQVMMGRSVQVGAAPGAAVARDNNDLDGGAPLPSGVTTPPAASTNGDTQGAPNALAPAPTPAGPWNSVADNPITNSTPYKVATDNSSGLSAIPQAIADATDAKSLSNGLNTFGKVMAPLGAVSNGISLAQDIHNDHPMDAAADAAGLGSSAITLGQMGGFVATAGGAATAGALLGAGAGGYAAGNLLANKTEVGPDAANTVGGIDHMLGDAPGSGAANQSTLVGMDDFRQEAWKKGGLGNDAAAVGVGIAEGAVGLAGAVGGLAEGAWHGLTALGKSMPDSAQEGGY